MEILPLSKAVIVYGAHLRDRIDGKSIKELEKYLKENEFAMSYSFDGEWDFYKSEKHTNVAKKTQIVFGIEGQVIDVKFFTNLILED